MKALISPNENNRIVEVSQNNFPVAKPLFWVDCPDNITVNWTYSDGIFNEPVTQITKKTQLSSLEFLDKFSENEQLTIVTATLQSAQVKLWYDKMLGADYIDLADVRTIGGLSALVQAGLITAKRKDEILA